MNSSGAKAVVYVIFGMGVLVALLGLSYVAALAWKLVLGW